MRPTAKPKAKAKSRGRTPASAVPTYALDEQDDQEFYQAEANHDEFPNDEFPEMEMSDEEVVLLTDDEA